MEIDTTSQGVVLLAHGSRDPLWHQPLEAVAVRLRQLRPGLEVRCAYLELSAPDLGTAVEQLISLGASRIGITPVFLGVGKHAREDIPRLVASLRQCHPGVDFELRSPVGEHPDLIDLIARIALG